MKEEDVDPDALEGKTPAEYVPVWTEAGEIDTKLTYDGTQQPPDKQTREGE
jgi:hypothetical protein